MTNQGPVTDDVRSVAHVVCTFEGFGGAELVPIGIAARARARGRLDRLVVPAGGQVERMARAALGPLVEAVPVFRAERTTRLGAWRFALGARARVVGCDVVHVHLPSPTRLGVGLLALAGRPAVVTFHLLPDRRPARDLILWTPAAVAAALERARRRAPIAFTIATSFDRERLRRLFPGVEVHAVPYAPPLEGTPGATLPFGRGLRLLAVGRLHHQKGYDELLRALAADATRDLAWTLCLVGDGEERPALEAQAAALGLGERVRFCGALPAAGLFSQADVFLATSRFESLNLALVEALGAGVPALASPIAVHREVLSGVDGALLDDDRAKWPAQMASLFADPARRRELGARGVARAREAFTPEAQDERFTRLYEAVARDAGRGR